MSSVPAIIESVDSQESRRLADCERRIEAGFVEAGKAFREIRDERLYPAEYGGGGFDAYCRERWGMSRARVDQMIRAAEIAETINADPSLKPPRNEGQARPLAKFRDEPEFIREVWKEVQSLPDARPTRRAVLETIERLRPTGDPQPNGSPSQGPPPVRLESLAVVRVEEARNRFLAGVHTSEDRAIITAIIDSWIVEQ